MRQTAPGGKWKYPVLQLRPGDHFDVEAGDEPMPRVIRRMKQWRWRVEKVTGWELSVMPVYGASKVRVRRDL